MKHVFFSLIYRSLWLIKKGHIPVNAAYVLQAVVMPINIEIHFIFLRHVFKHNFNGVKKLKWNKHGTEATQTKMNLAKLIQFIREKILVETSRMGRSWWSSSWVSPCCPALLIVWCPTTIFHFAFESFSAESTSYFIFHSKKKNNNINNNNKVLD